MVNELSYCPRLFFLEWVQARFAGNTNTVEGRYHHRSVDRQEGGCPRLRSRERIRRHAPCSLSSRRLGLIDRVDLAEGSAGVVRPMDTKHGRPSETPGQAWEPKRVQLCVQGGERCSDGASPQASSLRGQAPLLVLEN